MFQARSELHPSELIEFAVRFAHIAELNEWDNRQHLERMRRYVYLLGTACGLPLSFVEQISAACVLHDVGKVATPKELLLRQGKFTQFEWQTMEHHTIDGAAILANAKHPVLQIAESIALTHHERWDGSGYPRGLKGEEIPMESRLCALADVYDALTTDRVYKKRMDEKGAYQLIVDASGTLFDPAVVTAFQNCYPEVLKISKSKS